MPEAASGLETTDHPHQKSAWFTHGDVIPKGITLNQKIKGRSLIRVLIFVPYVISEVVVGIANANVLPRLNPPFFGAYLSRSAR